MSTKKENLIRRWNLKLNLPERFGTAKNIDEFNIEIKAILERMTKEKEKKS